MAGNVGTALTSLAGRARAGRGRGLRGVVVPARGHGAVRSRGGGAAQPRARTTSTATAPSTRTARPSSRRSHASQPMRSRSRRRISTGVLGGAAQRVAFGPGGEVEDRDGRLWWRGEPLLQVAEIRLRGPHNRANAMAAAAVCLARGLPADAVRNGLATFGGVAHRLEEVANAGGVLYVNDSKATNVASAVVGIESFPGGVHMILGGRGKHGNYGPLASCGASARRRRVPDRRGGGRDRRGARRHRRRRCATAATSPPRSPPRAPPPAPARSCCCRRPARPTTSTGRSRNAATTSASLGEPAPLPRDRHPPGARVAGRSGARRSQPRWPGPRARRRRPPRRRRRAERSGRPKRRPRAGTRRRRRPSAPGVRRSSNRSSTGCC